MPDRLLKQYVVAKKKKKNAARVVRPDSQIVVLLGDGAAGFSLMDVDTLVRHNLPVVMVVGNNGMWGLEKHPMQFIYGWDVACDLQPETRYDEVVRSLGGAGEIVRRPDEIGPALDRAFASGVPYLVNVMTDPGDVYPADEQPRLRPTPARPNRGRRSDAEVDAVARPAGHRDDRPAAQVDVGEPRPQHGGREEVVLRRLGAGSELGEVGLTGDEQRQRVLMTCRGLLRRGVVEVDAPRPETAARAPSCTTHRSIVWSR